MEFTCALHKDSPITQYCETCQDPVCQLCTSRQPHSGPTHEIIDLSQAANMRKNHYVYYLNNQINPIREEAQNRISELQKIRQQQDKIKKVIQKDIQVQFQSIRARLQQQVSNNITQIHVEIKHYQMYIQQLDDLFDSFSEVYENPQAFLISYLNFDKQLKKLQAIQFSEGIVDREKWNEKVSGLPRQLPEIYQKIQSLELYKQRNMFLNKVVNKYLKFYHERIKQEKANTLLKAKKINHTYNVVISKIVGEQQSAKVCIFCASPFTKENANQGCGSNRTFKINTVYPEQNWEHILPNDARGTKRHFWYGAESLHRKRPTLETHSIIRKTLKKHYFNSLSQLQSVKFAIRTYEIDNQKKLEQIVFSNDPQKTGYISKVAFQYTMAKTYKIPQNQIESLLNLLTEEGKGVNYAKLAEVLNNPVEDYFKFEKQEQQMEKSKPVAPVSVARYRY